MKSRRLVGAITLALLPACTQGGNAPASQSGPSVTNLAVRSPPPASSSLGPSAAAVSKPLPARFRGTVSFIPASLADQMRATTWHQGCPVSLSSLRLLTLRYWGFDGFVHEGPMVVNGSVATD